MINECKNCGGNLVFSPKDKGCLCVSCGSVFPISYEFGVEKNDFAKAKDFNLENFVDSKKGFRCESCGANMIVNKNEIKSTCVYCGNSSIAEIGEQKLMTIDTIIPFCFDKKEAVKVFQDNLSNHIYANKKIFKGLKEEDISGVYVNAFVFDLKTTITYSGVFSYTETYRDSKGESKSRIRYKHVNGTYDRFFNNLTIESNSHIEQSELSQVLPYGYNQAVKFETEFTHGFALEYHNEEFDKCFSKAETLIRNEIKRELLNKYNCDRVESLDLIINFTDKKYNYCLLPMYIINKKYKDKSYKVLMNGQTGAISKLPKSAGKIIFTVLLIFGIIAAITLLTFFLN